MVREIFLTQGKVTLVDDADYESLSQYHWQANRDWNTWYARRRDYASLRFIYMHRHIMAPPSHRQVDHKDRDGLNNQRGNLRLATASQNAANAKFRRNRFGITGICLCNNWLVRVANKHIGSYRTARAAALAYNFAARKAFGEFARLNDIGLLEASGVFDAADAVYNERHAGRP